MTKYTLGLLMILPAGMWAHEACAVPEPSRAPVSWELRFTFDDPQRITLVLPGNEHATTYWYVKYQVENDSGQDIQFFPSAVLVTDSLQVIQAGDQISPSVYDAIKERLKITDPFLLEPRRAMGPLLQGEDNTKTSVVVFRQFNPNDNVFTIFFSGLSGEIRRIRNPNFDRTRVEGEDNPRLFTLRKTLAIEYRLPGDPRTRRLSTPIRVTRDWIMR